MIKEDVTKKLIQTNIKLERKVIELLSSVNTLTKKIDGLLDLFAKASEFIERGEIKEPLTTRLNELLEQNKDIAKGLLLLERYVMEKGAFGSLPKKKVEL